MRTMLGTRNWRLAFALANEIGKEGWAKYLEVIKRHSELALFSLTRLNDAPIPIT
jgi:hypothetical protein